MQQASFRWPPAEVLTRLVRDAQGIRPDKVDELLSVLRPALVVFFSRYREVDADDLAQRACVRIVGALPRIDGERADAYISTVARNLLRTAYRAAARNRFRSSEVDTNVLPSSAPAADKQVEYEELVAAVHRACFASLKPDLRDVVIGLLHGDTHAEIANTLQINPTTVRTRLMRVRAILRTQLAAYLDPVASGSRCSRGKETLPAPVGHA